MTATGQARGAAGKPAIQWKIIKPGATGTIKFRMMSLPSTADVQAASVPHPVMSAPGLRSGQSLLSHVDESSSTTSSSDMFDRTPSNTETEDTNISSSAASENNKPLTSIATISEVPRNYLATGCPNGSRKRVALSDSRPMQLAAFTDNISSSLSSVGTTPASKKSPPSLESQSLSNYSPTGVSHSKRQSWRAGSSIPKGMPWEEYGRQCVLAANASRLNPYALHTAEHRLLANKLSPFHATAYLNVRNGILRLWTRNPMVSVSEEEAVGCAKYTRHFELALFAYKWLFRNGYINFGCVDVPKAPCASPRVRPSWKQKTIVVIGAGMSGLGCARQLENLISQLQDHWISREEHPPKVMVLEGRRRIGGRVYSHPLRSQVDGSLPSGLRNTAEMGAQIITGFQRGNPLDAIIRGQLGLHYHLMWDEIVMHDSNGQAVDRDRDLLVNKIHNDVLERTSDFRLKPTTTDTLEGLQDYVDICQEPGLKEFHKHSGDSQDDADTTITGQDRSQVVPPGFAKLQGRTQVVAGNSSTRTAAQAAKSAGWELRPGISRNHSLNLDSIVKHATLPNLGSTMDEALRQYQHLVELTPQDMRLLNWHYADLEYANAAAVHQLSLSGHDQDSGNEFEGRHSEVVGGYIQVPRGLMLLPFPLDVQFGAAVKKVTYSRSENGSARVECHDGESFLADKVVLTAPLGVLKAQSIQFEPNLPDWKRGAIDRMGFGVLNKLVLVFERPFWDEQYDMFGMLNEAERVNSLNPDDYTKGRGKFYLVWNCLKNSGRPMLIALMSGHAAHAAETTPTEVLMKEVMARLSRTFAPQPVPAPVEVIVTRWKKDPFTKGTYSFVAPGTQPGDYDVMARRIGNLHFAGEATCGTHPATVHGAYLSGLRAAEEVIDKLIGPIKVPEVLVGEHIDIDVPTTPVHDSVVPLMKPARGRPRKGSLRAKKEIKADAVSAQPSTPAVNPYRSSLNGRVSQSEDLELLIQSKIMEQLGPRPLRPTRPGVNPFLVYTAEKWGECKATCSAAKQAQTGNAEAKATRNEVRAAIGKQWRELGDEEKKPYLEQCEIAQQQANEARAQYELSVAAWDKSAREIRTSVAAEHRVDYADAHVTNRVLAEGREIQQEKEMNGQADIKVEDVDMMEVNLQTQPQGTAEPESTMQQTV